MRKLLIPDTSFTAAGPDGAVRKVSAVEELRILISVPSRPEQPFTLDDIRTRLPVVEKLEAFERNGETELLLEDAEYALILAAVKDSTWVGVSRAALELADAVENAETIDIKEQD